MCSSGCKARGRLRGQTVCGYVYLWKMDLHLAASGRRCRWGDCLSLPPSVSFSSVSPLSVVCRCARTNMCLSLLRSSMMCSSVQIHCQVMRCFSCETAAFLNFRFPNSFVLQPPFPYLLPFLSSLQYYLSPSLLSLCWSSKPFTFLSHSLTEMVSVCIEGFLRRLGCERPLVRNIHVWAQRSWNQRERFSRLVSLSSPLSWRSCINLHC